VGFFETYAHVYINSYPANRAEKKKQTIREVRLYTKEFMQNKQNTKHMDYAQSNNSNKKAYVEKDRWIRQSVQGKIYKIHKT